MRHRFDWWGALAVAGAIALLILVVAYRVDTHVKTSESLAESRSKQTLCIASAQDAYFTAVGSLLIASINNDDTGVQLAKQGIVDASAGLMPLRLAVACKLDP